MADESLGRLEAQRAALFAELAATGDFRRGSLNLTYRRCGKPNCACAAPEHPGHGPRWLWTRSRQGKTATRQLDAGEVDKVRAELANHVRFAALSEAIVEVNEEICQTRPVTPAAQTATERPAPAAEKGGSSMSSRRRSRRN